MYIKLLKYSITLSTMPNINKNSSLNHGVILCISSNIIAFKNKESNYHSISPNILLDLF